MSVYVKTAAQRTFRRLLTRVKRELVQRGVRYASAKLDKLGRYVANQIYEHLGPKAATRAAYTAGGGSSATWGDASSLVGRLISKAALNAKPSNANRLSSVAKNINSYIGSTSTRRYNRSLPMSSSGSFRRGRLGLPWSSRRRFTRRRR